jgi:hypothetical protein
MKVMVANEKEKVIVRIERDPIEIRGRVLLAPVNGSKGIFQWLGFL